MKKRIRRKDSKKNFAGILNNKNSKKVGLLIFCIIIFISSLYLFKNQIYENRDTQQIQLNAVYSKYTRNDSDINFQINVIKPLETSKTKFPVCILLHGDAVKEESMNFIIKALLNNGYMAIQLDIYPYSIIPTLNQLNSTLEYLLTRSDVEKDKIGILGHSRGGVYALLFGIIREDRINAVICGNYADWDYYFHMSRVMNYSIDFSYSINSSKPNNVLFTLDYNDKRAGFDTQDFLNNLTDFQFSQSGELFGTFSNGTAREVFVTSSYLSHASTLFDPATISKEITWLNQALDQDYTYSLDKFNIIKEQMSDFYQVSIIFLAFEGVLAYVIFIYSIWILSFQDIIIKKISVNISRLVKKFSEKWEQNKKKKINSVERDINFKGNSNKKEYSKHNETIWKMYKEISSNDQKLIPIKKNDDNFYQEYNLSVQSISNKEYLTIIIKYISIIWVSSLVFKLYIGPRWSVNDYSLSEFSLIFVNYFSRPTYFIFDEFFRFAFIELFLIVIIMANYFILKKKSLKKLGDYSVFHTIKGFFISTEMFFIYILFLSLLSRDFVGVIAPSIDLRNFVIMIPFFYYINLFVFDFANLRYLGSKFENLKSIVLQILIYIPIVIPEIFTQKLLPELYVGLFTIIFVNPIIYKLFKNFTILAFFDYFFLIQTFTYLHF